MDPANGLDQQSEAVAEGYCRLAYVIHQQRGDSIRAEKLVRESLRIRKRLYADDHSFVAICNGVLACILQSQGNFTDETKELFERCLAITIKNSGPDVKNAAVCNSNLGDFYKELSEEPQTAETRKEHLRLSQSSYKEAQRIFTKIHGPDNLSAIKASSNYSMISQMLSKA